MPYRSFNPTNSSVVPTYVGNSLSEYEKLFKQKQQQFDVVQEGMMNVGDAAGGIQSIAKDDQFAKELYNNTQTELAEMAKQGDYENMLPRVSKLARKFAQDARPLAERYQQRAAYMTDLKKKYDEGKINSDQFTLAMKASDNLDKGMQRDPITGRLQGSYSGVRTIDAPDYAKLADEAMKNYKPSSGETVEIGSNGVYYIKTKNGREEITPDQIRNIVSNYMMASKDYQNYMSNVGELVDGANMPMYEQLAADPNKMKKLVDSLPGIEVTGPKGEKKKVSAAEYIKSQGIDPIQFIRQAQLNQERDKGMATALNYAVPKYTMLKTTQDVTMTEDALGRESRAESRRKQEKAEELLTLGTITNMGQSVEGLTPDQVQQTIKDAESIYKQKNAEFKSQWEGTDNTGFGRVYKDQQGRWLRKNPETGEVKDVSALRSEFQEVKVSERAVQDKKQRDAEFRERTGLNNIPASVFKQAEKEKADEMARASQAKTTVGGIESNVYSNEEIKAAGEAAYNKVMRQHESYKAYEKLVKNDTKFTPMYTNMYTTSDQKTLEGVTKVLNNMIMGLEGGSALNANYYSGDNSKWGKTQLDASDWKKLAGQLEIGGMAIVPTSASGAGLVVRVKPGSENVLKGKAGENMIIELPVDISNIIFRNNPAARQMFEDTKYVAREINNGGVARIRDIEIKKGTDGKYVGTKTPKDGGPKREIVSQDFQQLLTDLSL